MADYVKLKNFIEAALVNPRHPLFQMGMQHSPILQHYAVNVATLGAVTPEQWFKDYPDKTAKLEEVMALCEEQEAPVKDETHDVLTALKVKVAELETKLAALTPAPVDAATEGE